MKDYPLTSRPLNDSLVDLVRPRVSGGCRDAEVVPPFRVDTSMNHPATHALLFLTGVAVDTPTQPPTSRMKSAETIPSPKLHKKKLVSATNTRRREQCRANQARYRDRQRNAQVQLEKTVRQLHQEVDGLKRRYRELSSHQRCNQSPWSIVTEVFRLLESSFQSSWHMASGQPMTRQIADILGRSFVKDVAMGELRGVNALIGQLRLYSQSFGDSHLQLKRIEALAPGVLVAHAKLSVVMTELSMRQLFLQQKKTHGGDHSTAAYEHLGRLLLGQRFLCKCSVHFLFDEDSDRVVRLELKIDLMTPLLEVLGNLEDVVTVLNHFGISSECIIDDYTQVSGN